MDRKHWNAWAAWATVLGLGLLVMAPQACSQQSPAAGQAAQQEDEADGANKVRGRLPAYFAAVVTEQQRRTIYELQQKYHEQIAALQQQIAELEMQRDKEVDGVLTPEQLDEVNKKRAAAREKREQRKNQPTDEEPAAEGRP